MVNNKQSSTLVLMNTGSELKVKSSKSSAAVSKSNKSNKKNKRKRASKACTECQKRHVRCGCERPCQRCVRNNLECYDVPRASRKRYKINFSNVMLDMPKNVLIVHKTSKLQHEDEEGDDTADEEFEHQHQHDCCSSPTGCDSMSKNNCSAAISAGLKNSPVGSEASEDSATVASSPDTQSTMTMMDFVPQYSSSQGSAQSQQRNAVSLSGVTSQQAQFHSCAPSYQHQLLQQHQNSAPFFSFSPRPEHANNSSVSSPLMNNQQAVPTYNPFPFQQQQQGGQSQACHNFAMEQVFNDPFNVRENIVKCHMNPYLLNDNCKGLIISEDLQRVAFASPSIFNRLNFNQYSLFGLSQILAPIYLDLFTKEIYEDIRSRVMIQTQPQELDALRRHRLKTEHVHRMVVTEGDGSTVEVIAKCYRIFNFHNPYKLDAVYIFLFW